RHTQIKLEHSVDMGRDPVAAARQHLAAEAFAFKRTTGDGIDGELALRRGADLLDGRGRETQQHQWSRRHGVFLVTALRLLCRSDPLRAGRRWPPRRADSRTRTTGAPSEIAAWSENSRSPDRPTPRE